MERCDKCKHWTRKEPLKAWGTCSANKWESLANEFCNVFQIAAPKTLATEPTVYRYQYDITSI